MNKYEQLIEHIINDETDKARELFHTIVVEKSRDIYESLIDEQDLEEVGGNEVQGLAQDVQMDEEGISEEEEEGDEGSDEPALDSEEGEGEFGGEEHEEAEIEDRVVDLESALDELKAEFDALMAGEEHEEHEMPGIHGDEGHEEMGGEEEQSEFFEAEEKDEDDEEDEDKEVDESIVREYVEKVADTGQKNPSGKMAGTGSKTPQQGEKNTKSPLAGKNDMGGSSKNIARGGAEQNPDGTSPNASVKPKGELIGKVENTPGARAGNTFAKKESAKAGEGQTTSGTVGGVNAKSPLAK
jgi:hypothetical protein